MKVYFKTIILITIISFILTSPDVIAQKVEISVKIIPNEVDYKELVIGDSFSYEIFLENKENYNLSYDIDVVIIEPNGMEIEWSKDSFNRTLMMPGVRYKEVAPFPYNTSKVKIFSFSQGGIYKLKISPKNDPIFIPENTNQEFVGSYSHFFEPMPRWQKEIFDAEINSSETIRTLNEKMVNYSHMILLLTIVIAFFGFVEVFSSEKKRKTMVEILTIVSIFFVSIIIGFVIGAIFL